MKKPNYHNKIINTLNEVHKLFPTYSIGRHISQATDGEDTWGISDKELLFRLEKYKTELEINPPFLNDDNLEQSLHIFEDNDYPEDY